MMLMLTKSQSPKLLTPANSILLQNVLESLLDGVLILNYQGDSVYVNEAAQRICQEMNGGQSAPHVPGEIWQACEALIESRTLYPDRLVVIESEITLNQSATYRLRVRWLPQEDTQHPYIVVLIEDCYQSLQSRTIAEIQQYSLTPRQAEVWLLHRMGYSYQEIATELYISLNTVKKHLKDIYAKRQLCHEGQMSRSASMN